MCCGAAEDANAIDLDEHPVPVRKSTKLQAGSGRETNPTPKPDGTESATAEFKDMSDEKVGATIGGTPYSDLKSAGEPKMQESPIPNGPIVSPKIPNLQTSDAQESSAARLQTAVTSDQHSAAPTPAPITPVTREDSVKQTESGSPPTAVTVGPPTPLLASRVQESSNGDRSAQQETSTDKDVEMPDADPEEPVINESVKNSDHAQSEPTPPLPPPPPPPTVPRTNAAPPAHKRTFSQSSNAPTEQHKWLLPPIRNEFKGKKCLVLDLDETLVHSSFKVSVE